ncbi:MULTISPECIES: diaminobutyrate acetyltransferase [Sediminimonas]|uniref:L-2,4-diaminobutyric acid acetyltransferase n=1 Tax=Sediminimonas qiaohouensis TaxID=552061 RepID=A0A7C9HC15_9RHOB|nr:MULTISPECIES: diaminobutyrate acetyltransferase [Sediminimonas]MDR9484968.1 diaminobutyrate acetyltransferase [Sediminimonas sp.]MTJ05771.1 diaminobutyrate acetyltransferase [Sediminimonas qiaohouensis]
MRDFVGKPNSDTITLRQPDGADGAAVWELIRACKPLDENSMYCNLIQCDHFAETCVLAELDGEPVGWISAYVRPDDFETLFVWQVAVSEAARGRGLGQLMLEDLLERDACDEVTRLQTTITRDNDASWGLFKKFARVMGGALSHEAHYTREDHFDGHHATEHMVTIRLPAGEAKRAA